MARWSIPGASRSDLLQIVNVKIVSGVIQMIDRVHPKFCTSSVHDDRDPSPFPALYNAYQSMMAKDIYLKCEKRFHVHNIMTHYCLPPTHLLQQALVLVEPLLRLPSGGHNRLRNLPLDLRLQGRHDGTRIPTCSLLSRSHASQALLRVLSRPRRGWWWWWNKERRGSRLIACRNGWRAGGSRGPYTRARL